MHFAVGGGALETYLFKRTVVKQQSARDSATLKYEPKRTILRALSTLAGHRSEDKLCSDEPGSSKQLLLGTCIFHVYFVNHVRFVINEALLECRVGYGKYLYRKQGCVL